MVTALGRVFQQDGLDLGSTQQGSWVSPGQAAWACFSGEIVGLGLIRQDCLAQRGPAGRTMSPGRAPAVPKRR